MAEKNYILMSIDCAKDAAGSALFLRLFQAEKKAAAIAEPKAA